MINIPAGTISCFYSHRIIPSWAIKQMKLVTSRFASVPVASPARVQDCNIPSRRKVHLTAPDAWFSAGPAGCCFHHAIIRAMHFCCALRLAQAQCRGRPYRPGLTIPKSAGFFPAASASMHISGWRLSHIRRPRGCGKPGHCSSCNISSMASGGR